jgi:hypothetical protein
VAIAGLVLAAVAVVGVIVLIVILVQILRHLHQQGETIDIDTVRTITLYISIPMCETPSCTKFIEVTRCYFDNTTANKHNKIMYGIIFLSSNTLYD